MTPITRRIGGFSLLELTVVLMVLGVVAMLLAQFLGTAARENRTVANRDLLVRADDALLTFAMIHHRLPCPASSGDGREDCSAGQVGRLPYRDLGLPDAAARTVRYGVMRRAAVDPMLDADLAVDKDRYVPLVVLTNYAATPFPQGSRTGLDLCQALRSAMRMGTDGAYLHTTREGQPSQIARNVAYAVALPGVGDRFSGAQAGAAPVFDSPRRPTGPDYHDQVRAVGNDQLWTRMRCGDSLAAAGQAHFNAALSAAMLHTSLTDYKQQLAVSKKLADANVANATAAVLSGAAAVADAAGGTADTVSEALASTGAVSYRTALAAIATAAAVAVTVTAATLTGYAATAQKSAEKAYTDVDPLITDAARLKTDVLNRAKVADGTDIY